MDEGLSTRCRVKGIQNLLVGWIQDFWLVLLGTWFLWYFSDYLEFSTKCPCAQVTVKSAAWRQTGIGPTVCSSVQGHTTHCRCSSLSLFFLAVKMCLGEKFRCPLPGQESMQFLMGPEKQGSISLPTAPLPSWGHSREIQNWKKVAELPLDWSCRTWEARGLEGRGSPEHTGEAVWFVSLQWQKTLASVPSGGGSLDFRTSNVWHGAHSRWL